jgi:phosphopantothenoylcysteine decarboxylase/phosphopantothenate--cysteine ligase
MTALSGKRILLGVTGGIAAYKSVVLLREMQKFGAEVRCIATPSALRFIGLDTLSALTRQPVPVEVFTDAGDISESWTRHIHWGDWADLFVIAPCTANTLAKIVHGFSDNMLTSTVLAARCPVLICPTMDGGMYEAVSTRQNREKAVSMGFHLLEPEHGYLASGLHDTGRLPEIHVILENISTLLGAGLPDLSGKKVLVTAGATREHIDPVRFLSNPSTGKMGIAMAEAARDSGADVTLIHGSVSTGLPAGVQCKAVVSAEDMFQAVKGFSNADIIIMSAAVSDFRPKDIHPHKVKKDKAEQIIAFERTTDILQWLGENKRDGQIIIGFAMETEDVITQAVEKRERKKADWIIANSINESGTGFAADTNKVYVIGGMGEPVEISGSKKQVAVDCLKLIFG